MKQVNSSEVRLAKKQETFEQLAEERVKEQKNIGITSHKIKPEKIKMNIIEDTLGNTEKPKIKKIRNNCQINQQIEKPEKIPVISSQTLGFLPDSMQNGESAAQVSSRETKSQVNEEYFRIAIIPPENKKVQWIPNGDVCFKMVCIREDERGTKLEKQT